MQNEERSIIEQNGVNCSAVPASEEVVRFENITKSFGTLANDNISFSIRKGEILALLGENGSGKTTLMNMLSGIYYPDSGHIYINGRLANITSPRDAFGYGVGMIHQHFKLVDVFNAVENIVLGEENNKKFNLKESAVKVKEICDKYGFDIKLDKRVYDMSVSEKQTLEIVKVLYRGANILILDEPTAVLTPQETQKLFKVIKNMSSDGKSVIIITHKLHEVLSVSDRVAVLRKGRYIDTVETASSTESSLTEMMVGKKVELNIKRSEPQNSIVRMQIEGLNCVNEDGIKVLNNVTIDVRSGEILGIAGISGSGQRELLEAIAGLQHIQSGTISYYPPAGQVVNLRDKTPMQIRELGVRLSFVPEDRLGMGLVGNMDIVDNMILRSYKRGKFIFVDRKQPASLADRIISELQVITPSPATPVRKLSGGNIQKVLVGREIAAAPTVLMAAYPVRGLDIGSSYTIYNLLNEQKEKGVAVIFVGEDLDVLTELCDRILVISAGEITGILNGRGSTKEEIGLLMTKGGSN